MIDFLEQRIESIIIVAYTWCEFIKMGNVDGWIEKIDEVYMINRLDTQCSMVFNLYSGISYYKYLIFYSTSHFLFIGINLAY